MSLLAFLIVPPMALAQQWTSAGTMLYPRSNASAVLLKTGQVLVFGGGRSGQAIAAAERYDPSTRTWASAGNMIRPRSWYQPFVPLNDGRIFVAGGCSQGSAMADSEIYDPVQNTWIAAAPMSAPRWTHMLALLPDGKVLAAGGQIGYGCNSTASCEIYDPATNAWEPGNAMGTSRETTHGWVTLPDGRVLFVGGDHYCQGAHLPTTEVFDPAMGLWSGGPAMAYGRGSGAMVCLLKDGRVLASSHSGGGTPTTTECIGPTLDAWTPLGPLYPFALSYADFARLSGGRVLVAGGYSDQPPYFVQSCRLFHPTTNTWSDTVPLPEMRASHISVPLPCDRMLVAGGHGPTNIPLATAWVYEPPLTFRGYLPPVLSDGSGVYRQGRTLPIKFQLLDPDGQSIPDATPRLQVLQVQDSPTGTVFVSIPPAASGESSTDGIFRYDSTSCTYVYNMSTKGWTTGTYRLTTFLQDGRSFEVLISLR